MSATEKYALAAVSDDDEAPVIVARVFVDDAALVEQCAWFLFCDNEATATRDHPILGAVPICARCDLKVELLGG